MTLSKLLWVLIAATSAQGYDLSEIPLTVWPDQVGPAPIPAEAYLASHPEPARFHPAWAVSAAPVPGRLTWSGADAEPLPLVLVLVEEELLDPLEADLARWTADIALDGYDVLVEGVTGESAEDVKERLRELYEEGLDGAILVGDLPMAWFEFENDFAHSYPAGHAVFPCDLWFMDLDGGWDDLDGDGWWDLHHPRDGDVVPEIWLGRLMVSSAMGDRVTLLRHYLQKNHAYRRGEVVPDRRGLVYVDDDWEWWAEEFASEVDLGFPDSLLEYDTDITTKGDYMPRLEQAYDNVAVFVHSSPESHYFMHRGQHDIMWWTEVPVVADALFYDLFACSNANYSDYVNMAGVYTFLTEWGLLAMGSTKTGSMLERTEYYRAIGEYDSFGSAFRRWWASVEPYHMGERDSWYYGLTLSGDPTLRAAWSTLVADPGEVRIGVEQSGPVEVELSLVNEGLVSGAWTLQEPLSSWVEMTPQSGELEPGEAMTLSITVSPGAAMGAELAELVLLAPRDTSNPLVIPISLEYPSVDDDLYVLAPPCGCAPVGPWAPPAALSLVGLAALVRRRKPRK